MSKAQERVKNNKNKSKKKKSYVVDDDAMKLMRKQLADVGCKLHVGVATVSGILQTG